MSWGKWVETSSFDKKTMEVIAKDECIEIQAWGCDREKIQRQDQFAEQIKE